MAIASPSTTRSLDTRTGILCHKCGRFCPGPTNPGRPQVPPTLTTRAPPRVTTTRTAAHQHTGLEAAATSMAANVENIAETVEMDIEQLRALTKQALLAQGFMAEDVGFLAEVLLHAQLRDNSQGLIKLACGDFRATPNAQSPLRQPSTSPMAGRIDSRGAPGMVVLDMASRDALAKARMHGIGIVGTVNTCTGTGALGYYAEHIARAGYIGLVMSGCPEYSAPYGSSEAVYGTNAFAYGFPRQGGDPIVCDMGTTAEAYYGLMTVKEAGQSVAPDVGFDATGTPTTDPAAILQGGALRSWDRGPKGSSIALLVELLTGPLVGAAVSDKLTSQNWGNLVIVVDPGLLRGNAEACLAAAGELAARVESARPEHQGVFVRLPGHRSAALAATRIAAGTVPITPTTLAALQQLATNAPSSPPPLTPTPSTSTPTYSLATRLVHPKTSIQDPYSAAAPNVYQTSTFAQPSSTTFGDFDYSRSGNPTRTQLEEQMADIEGADRAFAFSSGMAAIAAVCRLVKTGEHIVAGDDLYGGTSRLLSRVVPNAGVQVSNVDTTDVEAVRAAIQPGKTKFVFLESPTNPRMQVCDLRAICTIAHEAGALVMVDNSIMAMYQSPLALGADISMTSATKYIGGHSDVTAGILAVKGEDLAKEIYFVQNAEGTGLGPWDCWLLLRGVKTMALRMERAAVNAMALARFLDGHPLVKKVNYPGLASSPGHAIHFSQATSGGSVLSFETGNHSSIPAEVRAARGLPDDLVRISVGIEDAEDLIADLSQALDMAMAAVAKQ